MANLNLSQFGENTSVSDADYTFVWDSAASISKKVSRNSWLNSGTLTSDAPVTISQTWGTTGTYTAFKVVANETAVANTLSNVLELWSGNAATLKLSIRKSGQIVGPSGTIAAPTYGFADTDWGTGFSGWYRLGTGVACSTAGGTISAFSITHTNIRIGSSIPFGWTSGTAENALDTILLRDSSSGNTLALRNGAAAQTFNVYGTSSASNANYARLALTCGLDGNATISTQALGTGTAGVLAFSPGNSERMRITAAGNVGIGTTSPTSKLDVEGSTRLGGVANIDRTAGTLANVISLQARGTAEASNFGNPLGNGAGEISENGLSGLIIGTRSTASLVLGTNNTERMRFLAVSGNVAIGATSAASKLTVTGGDVEVATIASGLILKSPDNTRYRVTVANGGTLSVAAV